MSPATEEPNTTTSSTMMMIDEIYEFSAPRFFDFIKDETNDHKIKAELWFDSLPAMDTTDGEASTSLKVEGTDRAQDLAQIYEKAKKFAYQSGAKVAVVYGGMGRRWLSRRELGFFGLELDLTFQ